ncbi:putative transmembrane protein [Salarias fasciatus]|uniref:putative transmembrane protein n=1 Tax=Salarias fasciatus TaxID=181472 RepID=UPI00117700DB|nr:putative transmembrane protein [Salarias fasciatus]
MWLMEFDWGKKWTGPTSSFAVGGDATAVMDYSAYCGRCLLFFFLAIFMDAVGFIIFLVGVAAPIKSWDFFVLSGPLLIFLSLVFWIFWYLGNLEVPAEDFLPR